MGSPLKGFLFFYFRVIYTLYYAKKETKTKLIHYLEVNIMANNIMNVKAATETKKETTGFRYRTPDGLIFTSREEFLDCMEGIK